MPWNAYFIALLIAFLLQTAVVQLFGLQSLDLLFALALFCGLTAPALDARLAAFWAGFAADIGSGGPIGAGACAFGLAGLLVTWLREALNVQIWWVRLLVAFLGAVPAQACYLAYAHYWLRSLALSFWQAALYVIVVSTLAALAAVGLTSLPLFLGWDRRRRRYPRPRW